MASNSVREEKAEAQLKLKARQEKLEVN